MKIYSDPFLNSLHEAFEKNPNDLVFKKYFALELYNRNEFKDAYALLLEVYDVDQDVAVEKAIADIKHAKEKETAGKNYADIDTVEPELEQKKSDTITFMDVAGMEDVKDAIRTDIIYPFQHPEIYQQYSKQSGGGILLFGPPGCGKTYIAKATAGEINANFYSISIHELISSYLGEGERSLHNVFQMARDNHPSVLFFDEIDAIGMSRGKTSGPLRTLVNHFLTEMDGIDSNNNEVLIIGATNLPWEVDSALRRPGRFDKVMFVHPPDQKARERLFTIQLQDKPHEEVNFEKLAQMTKQYSSADIVHICDEASQTAFKEAILTENIVKISQELLEEKAHEIKSSIVDWFSTVKNYIEYSNESGLFNSVKDYLDKAQHD